MSHEKRFSIYFTPFFATQLQLRTLYKAFFAKDPPCGNHTFGGLVDSYPSEPLPLLVEGVFNLPGSLEMMKEAQGIVTNRPALDWMVYGYFLNGLSC